MNNFHYIFGYICTCSVSIRKNRKGGNKCNASFSCNFHWNIHFLFYFHDLCSSLMSSNRKYNFYQTKLGAWCNISYSWDFDWKIYLCYHVCDSRWPTRSKSQFQCEILKNTITNSSTFNTSFYMVLNVDSIYGIILVIQGHFQNKKICVQFVA